MTENQTAQNKRHQRRINNATCRRQKKRWGFVTLQPPGSRIAATWLFDPGCIRALERLPFHDIEHADWQVAQGEDKENHHQHPGRLTPSSDLFDLSAGGARPGPRWLSQTRSLRGALHRSPLPLQHRRAAGYLVYQKCTCMNKWLAAQQVQALAFA